MVEIANTKDVLRKRVRRLLRLDRGEVDGSELRTSVLPLLLSLGEVALIGGAIRDVARSGRRGFASDLDFVVYGGSRQKFADAMNSRNARPNRFGGYALHFYQWKVDVWHLEDTWARTAGLRRVERLSDLLACTFFDWDSVVFDLRSGRLTFDDDYLRRLEVGVMDVRLEENPSPAGSLIRALRRAALWRVRFGTQLSAFCSRQLVSLDWATLVEQDKVAFHYAVLAHLDRNELIRNLSAVEERGGVESTFPVPRWEHQVSLPFAHFDRSNLSPHP